MQASAYVRPMEEIDGPGVCGLERPLRVSGLRGGNVGVSPPATIGCPLTAALDRWIAASVQPAAHRYFGSRVVEITQIASYGCRGRNGNNYGNISEHAFGNALDMAAFRLANGQKIVVVKAWWRGTPRERAFLQAVFAGACAEFYTVLGPGSDRYHYNHIHVDLLVSNARNGRHFCQPSPGARAGGGSAGRSESDRLDQADPLHRPSGTTDRKAAHCGRIATSKPRKTKYDWLSRGDRTRRAVTGH